jgi:2-methylcitrate dehydratase PrpD
MPNTVDVIDFLKQTDWDDLPSSVHDQIKLCLIDLIGVAASGARTKLSDIACDYASMDMGGNIPMIFDGRGASVAGVAMAGGMTIDALDGHDGFNPAKGHAGCGLLPALYAVAQDLKLISGRQFLLALTMGYELACRAALAQHSTVADYHTSGAWVAVAVAGVASKMMGLSDTHSMHAMGIAEYHGPRSQMMRCIDHPTMLKDGSGWGAMCGVSGARMAKAGFTGAPALTLQTEHWKDLGQDWLVEQQYFKPYPVCRWAQAPIEAVLDLKSRYKFTSKNVTSIHITSFHEAVRLGQKTATNTEEAQYSTSFPCAVALVHGTILPEHVADDALKNPEVQRLSSVLTMDESDHANSVFPNSRLARADITLTNGQLLESSWFEPKWDAKAPPTRTELTTKFQNYATPVLGVSRTQAIYNAVSELDKTDTQNLFGLLAAPIKKAGIHVS